MFTPRFSFGLSRSAETLRDRHVGRLIIAALLMTGLPGALRAQAVEPVTSRVIARSLIGETALDVRASSGTVEVGLAAETATITLDLPAAEVRTFSDSLARLLVGRRNRRTGWKVRIEEAGTASGALSVTMRIEGRDSTLILFAADESLAEVRQTLSPAEARVIAAQFRRAAAAALPPRSTPVRRAPNARRTPS